MLVHSAPGAGCPAPRHRAQVLWEAPYVVLATQSRPDSSSLIGAAQDKPMVSYRHREHGGNKQINLWNLIPVPDISSNTLSDKAVKICSTASLARDLDTGMKFSKTKSVAKIGGLTVCSGIRLDQNRNTSKGVSVTINYYGVIKNN